LVDSNAHVSEIRCVDLSGKCVDRTLDWVILGFVELRKYNQMVRAFDNLAHLQVDEIFLALSDGTDSLRGISSLFVGNVEPLIEPL